MVNSITAITKHARPIGIQIAKVDDSFRHEIRRCGIHCKMTILRFVPWLSCRVWYNRAIKNLWSISKTSIPLNSESVRKQCWMNSRSVQIYLEQIRKYDCLQTLSELQYGLSMTSQRKTPRKDPWGELQGSEGSFQGIFHLERPFRPLLKPTSGSFFSWDIIDGP